MGFLGKSFVRARRSQGAAAGRRGAGIPPAPLRVLVSIEAANGLLRCFQQKESPSAAWGCAEVWGWVEEARGLRADLNLLDLTKNCKWKGKTHVFAKLICLVR